MSAKTLIAKVFASLLLAAPALAEGPVIFAAASLRGALEEVVGPEVTVSYAGSSTLARQIALGAPADVFISANADWMGWLEGQDLTDAATRRDLVSNALVVIGPAGQRAVSLEDLPQALGDGRLAMALVDAVPAGLYGRAALEALELWDALAPQVAQADNVRAALALVATGAAPFGIVYASDAQADPRVHIVAHIAPDLHPPIRYPAALIAGRDSPGARALLNRLSSAEALEVFIKHGFAPPEGT